MGTETSSPVIVNATRQAIPSHSARMSRVCSEFACVCREKYVGGPTNSVTRKELGALFDVTGTPSWRDVEGVQSATWRNYLQRLPGRAPTLFRRLGYAGESHSIQGDEIVLLSSHIST